MCRSRSRRSRSRVPRIESRWPIRPAVPLAQGELGKYVETIVSRNLFGPANKPPELSSTSKQTGYPGRPLRFQIRGRDPDTGG